MVPVCLWPDIRNSKGERVGEWHRLHYIHRLPKAFRSPETPNAKAPIYDETMRKGTPLPHCLYLPGHCIHVVPANSELFEQLHHEPVDGQPKTLKSWPIFKYDNKRHPIFLKSPQKVIPEKSPANAGPFHQDPYSATAVSNSSLCRPDLQNPPLRLPPEASAMPLAAPLLCLLTETLPAQQAQQVKMLTNEKAFENTSTSVAASQMRNALNNLADTVTDPVHKKVCRNVDRQPWIWLISHSCSRRRWTTSLRSLDGI